MQINDYLGMVETSANGMVDDLGEINGRYTFERMCKKALHVVLSNSTFFIDNYILARKK